MNLSLISIQLEASQGVKVYIEVCPSSYGTSLGILLQVGGGR